MAFTGTDILAALHAGAAGAVGQLDGTIDGGDAALAFGAGAEQTSGGGGGAPGTSPQTRYRGRRLGWRK